MHSAIGIDFRYEDAFVGLVQRVAGGALDATLDVHAQPLTDLLLDDDLLRHTDTHMLDHHHHNHHLTLTSQSSDTPQS